MKTESKNDKALELESIIANFEVEELEERLEFSQATTAGWGMGSDCPPGSAICYTKPF